MRSRYQVFAETLLGHPHVSEVSGQANAPSAHDSVARSPMEPRSVIFDDCGKDRVTFVPDKYENAVFEKESQSL